MTKSGPLVGAFPKIGIRPTIDGRRKGVRESLETQVMAMAIFALVPAMFFLPEALPGKLPEELEE